MADGTFEYTVEYFNGSRTEKVRSSEGRLLGFKEDWTSVFEDKRFGKTQPKGWMLSVLLAAEQVLVASGKADEVAAINLETEDSFAKDNYRKRFNLYKERLLDDAPLETAHARGPKQAPPRRSGKKPPAIGATATVASSHLVARIVGDRGPMLIRVHVTRADAAVPRASPRASPRRGKPDPPTPQGYAHQGYPDDGLDCLSPSTRSLLDIPTDDLLVSGVQPYHLHRRWSVAATPAASFRHSSP